MNGLTSVVECYKKCFPNFLYIEAAEQEPYLSPYQDMVDSPASQPKGDIPPAIPVLDKEDLNFNGNYIMVYVGWQIP